MTQKKVATLNIAIALIFALAILFVSAQYPDTYPTSTYILIGLWLIPSTILNVISSKTKN